MRRILKINAQFAAIGEFPVGVEIENHGVLSAGVGFKLVEVFFIETAFFVKGIMELIAGDARVASLIQKHHKGVHDVEESVFVLIFMDSVEPKKFVGTNGGVEMGLIAIASFGRNELVVVKKSNKVRSEVFAQGHAQKIF